MTKAEPPTPIDKGQEPTTSSPETPESATKSSAETLYERLVRRIRNNPVLAYCGVFVAGIGLATATIQNVDGIYRTIARHLPKSLAIRTLYGTVYEYGNGDKGIHLAKVTLDLDKKEHQVTNNDGEFTFEIPETKLESEAPISIRADGYAPFDYDRISLRIPLEKQRIALTPLREPPSTLANPNPIVAPVPDGAVQAIGNNSQQVSSFKFVYTFDPPGPRYWFRIQDRLWIELYQDNRFSFFSPKGRTSVDNCPGTVVLKSPITQFDQSNSTISFTVQPADATEVFIPDKGCNPMWLRFRRHATDNWAWLQEMLDVR